MATTTLLERAKIEGWTDEEVVARVRGGETALYEILMRRYNQRLYRAARAILKNDAEAEDVMQDAYVRAFQNLKQFEGRAPFSAWLLRIAVNEALGRKRGRDRNTSLEDGNENGEISMNIVETAPDPEQSASRAELGHMLEEVVLRLPDAYRAVVMLRDVEELSTAETAAALELSEDNVKIRLYRGHAMMREMLFERVGVEAKAAFPFMGERCDRVVAAVFARLEELAGRN
ncbi:MAG TPA: RNA polymerase sigma factor [Candidatus Acidoferrum sp.]|nr:RNA polymerase sigma factor [Candidatus Acidoferrum sp.]